MGPKSDAGKDLVPSVPVSDPVETLFLAVLSGFRTVSRRIEKLDEMMYFPVSLYLPIVRKRRARSGLRKATGEASHGR